MTHDPDDQWSPFAELVGTVPDAVVAEKAGVSRSAVTARRRQGVSGRRSGNVNGPSIPCPIRAATEIRSSVAKDALGFTVVATRGELRATFIVVGSDIAVARSGV